MYFRFDHHHQSFSSISFLPSLLRVFETLKSIINHHFFAFPRSNCYFRKCWKIGVAFYNVLQTRETIHRILSIPPRFLLIESTNLGVVSRSIEYIVHNRSLPSTKSHERFAIDSILSQCNNDDDDDVDDDESKPVAINFLQRWSADRTGSNRLVRLYRPSILESVETHVRVEHVMSPRRRPPICGVVLVIAGPSKADRLGRCHFV